MPISKPSAIQSQVLANSARRMPPGYLQLMAIPPSLGGGGPLISRPVETLKQLLDIVLHMSRHLDELVAQFGPWFYVILFLIIFCETGRG